MTFMLVLLLLNRGDRMSERMMMSEMHEILEAVTPHFPFVLEIAEAK